MPRRRLTPLETAEARLVFGDGLDYTRAWVVDNTIFPDLIAYVGRSPRPNAVTLGNVSYFGASLRTTDEHFSKGDYDHFCWLIHELTHQWQYQTMGWRYLLRALSVQIRQRSKAYDYKGVAPSVEDALRSAAAAMRRLADFNMEQQGDLARDYYRVLKEGRDAAPWEPFVGEFRRLRRG